MGWLRCHYLGGYEDRKQYTTGDWDLVVIAHTSFTLLPPSAELVDTFRDKETDRLRAYLEEQRAIATSSDEKRSLKQIERALKKLEQRLQAMADSIARDSARTITSVCF